MNRKTVYNYNNDIEADKIAKQQKFWSYRPKCDFVSRWSIWNGNGWSSLVLHFQVFVDSIDLTWNHVAKSSHLAANVMTHRHTDRPTDKPSGEVKNIIPFFKGIMIRDIRWKKHIKWYKLINWEHQTSSDTNKMSAVNTIKTLSLSSSMSVYVDVFTEHDIFLCIWTANDITKNCKVNTVLKENEEYKWMTEWVKSVNVMRLENVYLQKNPSSNVTCYDSNAEEWH